MYPLGRDVQECEWRPKHLCLELSLHVLPTVLLEAYLVAGADPLVEIRMVRWLVLMYKQTFYPRYLQRFWEDSRVPEEKLVSAD